MAEGGGDIPDELKARSLGSDFLFDFYCELCVDDGKHVEAEGFCVECDEYLCGDCYHAHTRNRHTRHHQLLDKDNMPKDKPLSSDRLNKAITTKCEFHTGELVKYYCKTHDVLGCSECLVTGHRSCTEVESILEKSENILDSQEYTDLIHTLNSLTKKSRAVIATAHAYTTKTKKCRSVVINSVKLLRKKINEILDKLEQDIVKEVDTIVSEEEEKNKTISNDCSTITESVETMLADFETLQSSRRVCQLYITKKERGEQVKALQDKIRQADEILVLRTFKLEPNRLFRDLIENHPTLGKISSEFHMVAESQQTGAKISVPVTILPTLVVSSRNEQNTTEGDQTGVNKTVPMEIPHVKDIHICSYLTDSRISGSAVLSISRLVVVQSTITWRGACSSVVKLLNTQTNQPVIELSVCKGGCAVTVINRNKVAVTFDDKQAIILLNVSANEMKRDREISVDGECHGVAYNKYRLVVLYTRPPKLEIMDLDGNVMKKIEMDNGGNQLFTCPAHVCVSKDGETIYVSDSGSNKVTSLTFDGIVKNVYTDPELKCPAGVCVDHHGNVYVCNGDSRNVHLLTADLAKIKTILTHIGAVWSLSHCQETNRLYVGMDNRIKMFQLI